VAGSVAADVCVAIVDDVGLVGGLQPMPCAESSEAGTDDDDDGRASASRAVSSLMVTAGSLRSSPWARRGMKVKAAFSRMNPSA
jgi:hypothetical protein